MSEQQAKNGVEPKPPTMGLNDNLEFMGRLLHVQTEHTEFPVARIVTHVFSNGRVLLSKKTECPPDILESRDFNGIQDLMNAQHNQVLKEIAAKQARILGSR
ncbi:MAG TPA: hypothetical protein VMG30_01730 [Acidobacteriota bacterium]|nr:hypothetical protein [Acidobacteriota bacterium]